MVISPRNEDETIIMKCELCPLSGTGYAFPRIKRGEGPKVMIIGEAPGKEESKQHLAFVGRSGKLLNEWIDDLDLNNYVITNIVRHRPIKNNHDRPPTKQEIDACFPYLAREIIMEKPDYIILLGRSAMHGFRKYIDNSAVELGINWKDKVKTVMKQTLALKLRVHMTYEIEGLEGTMEVRSHPRVFVLWHPSYIIRGYSTDNILELLKKQIK